MNMTHSSRELLCQIMAGKMDVQERRLGIAMTGKLCNLVDFPPRAG